MLARQARLLAQQIAHQAREYAAVGRQSHEAAC